MVIHDLKHPTESMISQLSTLHTQLLNQLSDINEIDAKQESLKKFINDISQERTLISNQ